MLILLKDADGSQLCSQCDFSRLGVILLMPALALSCHLYSYYSISRTLQHPPDPPSSQLHDSTDNISSLWSRPNPRDAVNIPEQNSRVTLCKQGWLQRITMWWMWHIFIPHFWFFIGKHIWNLSLLDGLALLLIWCIILHTYYTLMHLDHRKYNTRWSYWIKLRQRKLWQT